LTILATALAFVSMWVLVAAAGTAVWLTEEVRVVGLATLATVSVASVLVLYFDWRVKLRRRIVAERHVYYERGKAA
jgi:hypothetical protein